MHGGDDGDPAAVTEVGALESSSIDMAVPLPPRRTTG
jgi:hypothetical protein